MSELSDLLLEAAGDQRAKGNTRNAEVFRGAVKELQRVCDRNVLLEENLAMSNVVLRSTAEIVKRKGKATHWRPFRKLVDRVLKQQHELMGNSNG